MLLYCVHRKTNGGNLMSLVKNRMSICNLVCVILLLAIVIIQLFVPYYTYTNTIKIDGKKTDVISQASYGQITWFPKEDAYEGLADHFKSNDMFGKVNKYGEPYGKTQSGARDKFNLSELTYPHLYTLILTGFSITFFLMKRKSFVPSALAIAAGIITAKAFLTNRVLVLDPAFANRVVHNPTIATVNVVLGILLVCVGVFSLFGGFVLNPIAKKKAAKAA